MCEAVFSLFYGYNPGYLITFLFIWFIPLEEQCQKAVEAYTSALGFPTGAALDNVAFAQGIDWP